MKIGIVSSYFYPWYGGITEHVYYQYLELKKLGHEVKLITPFDGVEMLEDKNDLIKIGKPIPLILNGSVVKIPILFRRKAVVRNILEKEKFDIVHLHQPLFCVLGLTFLKCVFEMKLQSKNTPNVVGTFHASGGEAEKFIVKRLKFYFDQFRDLFDYRIAVSHASRDFVLPILPGNYEIISNGVDVKRFANVEEKIDRFDDGTINILFVGRLEPRKGLTVLLKSIPYIDNYTSKPFRLIVVGNGILTKYYKSKVPREVSGKVIFTGGVSFDDLPKYYKTSHIFCSTASYGESFGIVLIEAMAAGLAIVAGDNEGYRKVIKNGINGRLVNPQDSQAIAATLGRLIEEQEERDTYARKNRADAEKYGWTNIISSLEKLYYGCL